MTKTERAAGWLMTLLAGLWLGLFPLVQDGSYSRITAAKWHFMLAFSALTLAVGLTVILMLLVRRQGRKLRLHPAQLLAVGYLGWVLLSAVFGSHVEVVNRNGQLAVWMGAIRYEAAAAQCCYIAVFLLMSFYPSRLRAVVNVAAASLIIFAGVVALQYAGFNPFGLFPSGLNVRTNYEFQGTIGNIDMVSSYICLVMPMLLFAFATKRTGLLSLLAGTAGALLLLLMKVQSGVIALAAVLAMLVLLMFRQPETRGRGCIVLACVLACASFWLLVGLPWLNDTERIIFPYAYARWKLVPLAAALLLALLSLLLSRHPGRAVPWSLLIVLIVLAVAVVAVALLRLPFAEGSGPWELQEALHGRPQDSFGSERMGIWRMTLQMARDKLLFGTGPDTFIYAMQEHMAETGQSLQQLFDNPHNMLLAVLSGSGVPALALYLALMACVAVSCLRASRRDAWPLVLLAGLAAYLLQGMFTFSICLVAPMFWAMLGMAVSQSRQQEVTPS